jgi:hypothetical protein
MLKKFRQVRQSAVAHAATEFPEAHEASPWRSYGLYGFDRSWFGDCWRMQQCMQELHSLPTGSVASVEITRGDWRRKASAQAERMKLETHWPLASAKVLIRALSEIGQRKATTELVVSVIGLPVCF